jgi:hypothetical protein
MYVGGFAIRARLTAVARKSGHGVLHCLETSVASADVTRRSGRPINWCVHVYTASSLKLYWCEVYACFEIPSGDAELSPQL